MKATIATKLAQLSRRLEELNGLLASESATADMDSYRKLTREHAEISPVVELYHQYVKGEGDLQAAQEMSGDPSMREFAESEIKQTRERLAASSSELQKQAPAEGPQRRPQHLSGCERFIHSVTACDVTEGFLG